MRADKKIWVKVPSMNYRQSSGVEFRGKYVTVEEYKAIVRRQQIARRESGDKKNGTT